MKIKYLLVLVIVISIVTEIILLTITWDAYANVLVAIGTLALAAVTIYSIRESNKREQKRIIEQKNKEIRDRREKLCDEVLKWAIEIFRNYTSLSQCYIVFIDEDEKKFVEDEEEKIHKIYNSRLINNFQALRDEGKYIIKIAPKISAKAGENAAELWGLLTNLIQLLDSIRIALEIGTDFPTIIEISDAIEKIAPICNEIIAETAETKLGLANID